MPTGVSRVSIAGGIAPTMPLDLIRYDVLVQEALRGMVRDVLIDVAKSKALPGDHHFFITFDTTADGVQLCAEIGHPNVGLLWDTFHANVEEKNVAEALRLAGPFLKHVHTCENDRGTPGTGHVDWPGVFSAIRDLQYDAWLTIESFGFALGDIAAAASAG